MSESLRVMLKPPRPSTRDLIAGISVALILIPQSLAYAEIAGVPEYVGLYAAALPPIAASLIASSPYLQTGPVAIGRRSWHLVFYRPSPSREQRDASRLLRYWLS